jgi:hypothetical protein
MLFGMDTDERFEHSIIYQVDCWIWTRRCFLFYDAGHIISPARWAYKRKHGKLPPLIVNTCGTPRCCNPEHHTTPNDRFWSRLNKLESGCWEWTGGLTDNGYGYVGRKIERLAHRLAWLLTNGPIVDGLFVLHRCDNRRCCNPDHLFLGTASDNMRDMHTKGRANPPRGIRNAASKMNDEKAREIHARASAGENISGLAREFGISRTAIYFILGGKNWRELDLPVLRFQANGERHGHAKLTEFLVRQAHARVGSGETLLSVADELGICSATLHNAINGKTWKHLGLEPLRIGARRGTKTNTAKLNDDQVREIRQAHSTGETIKSMCARFGVGYGTLQALLSGRTWRHVI